MHVGFDVALHADTISFHGGAGCWRPHEGPGPHECVHHSRVQALDMSLQLRTQPRHLASQLRPGCGLLLQLGLQCCIGGLGITELPLKVLSVSLGPVGRGQREDDKDREW